jgi:hypothetical protein
MKRITAQIDVARSKASQAADVERYPLSEIHNLGKSMKCKYFLVVDSSFRLHMLIVSPTLCFLQMFAWTIKPRLVE